MSLKQCLLTMSITCPRDPLHAEDPSQRVFSCWRNYFFNYSLILLWQVKLSQPTAPLHMLLFQVIQAAWYVPSYSVSVSLELLQCCFDNLNTIAYEKNSAIPRDLVFKFIMYKINTPIWLMNWSPLVYPTQNYIKV